MIKIKVLKEFYLYYFAILTTYDLKINNNNNNLNNLTNDNNTLIGLEKFQLLNRDYETVLKYTYVEDNKFDQIIKRLIKEINQRLEKGNHISIVRNTIYSDFPTDIDYILSEYKQVFNITITSLSDLVIFQKVIYKFLDIFDTYIKNIIALDEVNGITNTVLKNLNDNTLKNITKITEKYNKSVRDYLSKMETININKTILKYDTLMDITKNNNFSFNRTVVPTGFKLIDNVIGGGLQSGRVYLIGGKTGLGKSSFLIQLTCNLLEQDKKVLIFTLENSVEETIERIYANISDTPLNKLIEYKDLVMERVQEFFNKHKNALVEVIFYPAETLTVEQIAERIRLSNDKYDVIFIDYLDLLRLQSSQKVEERIRLMKLVRHLKRLAQETNSIVVTPSQVQRGVYRSRIVEVDNIAESFGKIMEADGVFIIEATTTEVAQDGKLRINIGKMRHGKSGIRIEMKVDFSKMKFEEVRYVTHDEILDDEDDEKEKPTTRRKSKQQQLNDDEGFDIIDF
jgi:replicative DNA helicase